MEGNMSTNRSRVCSLEPNKIVQTMFARKYVSHLVPALMNINKSTPSLDENGDGVDRLEKIVRYEVDKALVVSTPEDFAWSHALKNKLQENINNVGIKNNNPTLEILKVPPNPINNCNSEITKKLKRPRSRSVLFHPRINKKEATKQKDDDDDDDEQEQIRSRLANLRSILPGGNEMGVNELFSEVGSYITCLELQVNTLRCLVETHND